MTDHHATWGHPPRKRAQRWSYSRAIIAALLGLAVVLMATVWVPKAIAQAQHDSAHFQEYSK